jgi:AcrR family transcriptional regulator
MNDRSFIYGYGMRSGVETNGRIRHEALRLFVERGIDAVSIRDIGDAAGIRPSTVYVHWRSREALIADLFRDGYRGYARRLRTALQEAGSFAERLDKVVALVCRLHDEDEVLFRFLLLSQHAALPKITETVDNPVEIIVQMVAEAQAQGAIEGGAEPALIAAAIVGIVVQAATFRHYGRLPGPLSARIAELTHMCRSVTSAEPRHEETGDVVSTFC